MNKLKSVRWYLATVFVGFSFYTYSQMTGMRWFWATKTAPPSQEHPSGSRYFFHK
ncbi:MAG: hypothetical protein JSS79_16820 [Bacteroidetes bacterium]|nr:hypothetical protein [Bacteroidota bacterium]